MVSRRSRRRSRTSSSNVSSISTSSWSTHRLSRASRSTVAFALEEALLSRVARLYSSHRNCCAAGLSRNTASVPTCSTLSNNRAAALSQHSPPLPGHRIVRESVLVPPRAASGQFVPCVAVVVVPEYDGVARQIRQRRPRAPRSRRPSMSTTSYDVGANRPGPCTYGRIASRRRPGLFSRRSGRPIRRATAGSWQKSSHAPTSRMHRISGHSAESRRTETRRALRCAPARRGCRTRSSTRRRPTRGTSPRHPSTSRPQVPRTYLSTVSRSLALIAGACAGSCAHAAGRVLAGTTSPRLDLGTTRGCAPP